MDGSLRPLFAEGMIFQDLLEVVALAGGMEQGMLLPSISLLIGCPSREWFLIWLLTEYFHVWIGYGRSCRSLLSKWFLLIFLST